MQQPAKKKPKARLPRKPKARLPRKPIDPPISSILPTTTAPTHHPPSLQACSHLDISPPSVNVLLEPTQTAKRKTSASGCRAVNSYEFPLRARLVRIYPTVDQQIIFRKWFAGKRFVYNQAVEYMNKVPECSLKELRNHFFKEKKYTQPHEWLVDIPYDILDAAFHDLIKARAAIQAKNKLRKQRGQTYIKYTFQFRTRRDPQQVIEIRKRWWNLNEKSKSQFAPLFGPRVTKRRANITLPESLQTDILLRYDRLGRYFLCIPQQIKPHDMKEAPINHHSTIALDPGVRTFQTCYDADGMSTEWGCGDMNGLFRLCYSADKLQTKISEKGIKYQQRRRRRKALYRINEKIRNRVKELHCKLAVWLCRNYKVILLPKFETQNMIRRGCRKLRSKTARAMCTWSHYKFQQLLKQKTQLYPWCKLIICDEAYTSKTCGQCGIIHSKLGGNKLFKCPSCDYTADRDISASRNILLRYLTLNKVRL